MEAARLAARRGHEVVLYEKNSYLGGLVLLAAIVKDLETEDFAGYIRYLETQLKKEKVTVHMKTAATPAIVRAEKPDVLLLATGAAHTMLDLQGVARGKVIQEAATVWMAVAKLNWRGESPFRRAAWSMVLRIKL